VDSPQAAREALSGVRVGEPVKLSITRASGACVIEYRPSPHITRKFELDVDPNATELELTIRRSLVTGKPERSGAATATRPLRLAG
jgi:hypothetical protein